MADDHWLPVDHEDLYHGRIDTTDRRSFWIFPRVHRAFGWCVEVRAGSPDGAVLERRWFSSRVEAQRRVGDQRSTVGRLTELEVLALPWTNEQPRADLGVIVAHGWRGRNPASAQIDGDEATLVCRVKWVEPGWHEVVWPAWGKRRVLVERHEVVHAHTRWLLPVDPPQDRMVPPWHVCHLRSLRFEDGLLLGGFSHGQPSVAS